MTDTAIQDKAVINGTRSTFTQQLKRRKPAPTLEQVTGLSEMRPAPIAVKVSPNPTDWSLIRNGQCFSLAPDGSTLCVKVSRSKFWNLLTGQSQSTAGGRCYLVIVVNG